MREVENAYLDSIAAAQRFVYAETQYLTSESIRIAIARRLSEPDGPEIVLATPKECCGFFEKQTMGVITARLMRDPSKEMSSITCGSTRPETLDKTSTFTPR